MRKIFETVLKVLAVAGIIIFIGGVGTMDYMVTVGKHYPLMYTLLTLLIGFILVIPAILYWGFDYGEK